MIKTIINNEEKEIEQIRLNNNKYVDYIDEKIGGGNEYEGNLPINIKFIGKGLQNYKIYGNTVNGESVGDRTGNLFDGIFLQGYWAGADGSYVAGYPTWICTNKLPCKPNTTYTLSFNSANSRWYGFVWFTENGDYLLSDLVKSPQTQCHYTASAPSNAAYMTIDIAGYPDVQSCIKPSDVTDLMLVEGSTALPYEPYGYKVPVTITNGTDTETITLYLPEQIRKIGDEMEYINFEEQKMVKKSKTITFTNSNDWSTEGNNSFYTNLPLDGALVLNYVIENSMNIPSVYVTLVDTIAAGVDANIWVSSTGRLNVYLTTIDHTLEALGQLFENTPLTITYELANMNELDITIPTLPTLSGTNTLSVETTVQPSKVYIKENIDYKRIFIATRSIENNFDNPYTFKSIDSENSTLKNYRIYGNTVDGESVGDLVESGEHTGEYLVLLTVTNGTDIKSTNIYLPEQLEKCGKEVDFINYETQILQKRKVIYGWHVDPSISDSSNSVTYLEDAIGLTPAAMGTTSFNYGSWENVFFMPKPCMLKSNGIVDYYLDPNDYSKKLDGTPSDISNSNYDGNAMMEWSKIWYKFVGGEVEGEGSFFVSSYKVDDTYHCWCNIDSQNNETEHFYTAIYNGTGTTKLRSISGIALTSANGNGSTNAAQETTRAMANNTTSDVEWYIDTYCDRILINALLVLMGKSLDTQVVYGRGIISGGQEVKEAYTTGTLNDKGLFWGDISNNNSAVKVFGMENWWGCAWRRTAGCVSVNGTMKIKLTYGTFDGSSVTGYNTSGNGYINNGTLPSTNSHIRKMHYNEFGYIPCDVTEGSYSTYYADYNYINTSGTMYSLFGGGSSNTLSAGAFFVSLNYYEASAFWMFAAALSCKPLAGKNPETNLKNISLPALPIPSGTNTLSVETTVQPSKMYIKGHIKDII